MSSIFRDTSHIEKFNGANFPQWKYDIFLLLEQHSLLDIVEGSETMPPEEKNGEGVVTNSNLIATWKQKDGPEPNLFHDR